MFDGRVSIDDALCTICGILLIVLYFAFTYQHAADTTSADRRKPDVIAGHGQISHIQNLELLMLLSTEELNGIIRNKVEKHFQEHGQGLFLSNLGLELSKECPGFRELLDGRKLAEYVQAELVDAVSIMEHSSNNLIKIVVPRKKGNDAAGSFSEPEISASTDVGPRYKRGVWLAFTKPLNDGMKRIIKTTGNPFFKDIPSSNEAPDGFIEIPRVEIASGEASIVHRNIQGWIASNDIDAAMVEVGDSKYAGDSVLDRIISALSESDLKRIQLPLDIIQKLSKA